MEHSLPIFIKMKVQDIFPTYNLYTYFMNKLLIFYSIVIFALILLIIFSMFGTHVNRGSCFVNFVNSFNTNDALRINLGTSCPLIVGGGFIFY